MLACSQDGFIAKKEGDNPPQPVLLIFKLLNHLYKLKNKKLYIIKYEVLY